MATSTTISVPTTPAVLEFNKLNGMVSNRLANTTQSTAITYWLNEMDIRTKAIAKAHGLSVNALITQWENWFAQVETARAKARG